jgi:hypothetical protein
MAPGVSPWENPEFAAYLRAGFLTGWLGSI